MHPHHHDQADGDHGYTTRLTIELLDACATRAAAQGEARGALLCAGSAATLSAATRTRPPADPQP